MTLKNHNIFLLIFLFISIIGHAQNFEGEIDYVNSYKSKIPNLTNERLELIAGNNQKYFIKDGYYKSENNGQVVVMQLYDPVSNRIYNKRMNSDTLYWFNANNNRDSALNFSIKKDSAMVLGYMCDAITILTKETQTTFFYNSKFKLNAAAFKKHEYNNWYFYATKTNAVPLKIVFSSKQFDLVSSAFAIKPGKLTSGFFAVDPKSPQKLSSGY